jgi:hypothetical protein
MVEASPRTGGSWPNGLGRGHSREKGGGNPFSGFNQQWHLSTGDGDKFASGTERHMGELPIASAPAPSRTIQIPSIHASHTCSHGPLVCCKSSPPHEILYATHATLEEAVLLLLQEKERGSREKQHSDRSAAPGLSIRPCPFSLRIQPSLPPQLLFVILLRSSRSAHEGLNDLCRRHPRSDRTPHCWSIQ